MPPPHIIAAALADTAEHSCSAPLSLGAFLASSEKRAYRRALLATRHADDALDIVQDAMMQLSRRYAQRPASEWPMLFARIVTNCIRDWHRRQTLRRKLFFWLPAEPEGEDCASPFDQVADPHAREGLQQLANGQLLQQLQASLVQLPARQREAFELRIWEGLDVHDTAVAMGCSQGSVKTHLSRALHRLRADLEGYWP
jgi:RNA polymerase sigma-70 factor (ECF subfamily)